MLYLGDQRIAMPQSDELWPTILADDRFWHEFKALARNEREAGLMNRVRIDPGFVSGTSPQILAMHVTQAGLICELIENIGPSEAREWLQRFFPSGEAN